MQRILILFAFLLLYLPVFTQTNEIVAGTDSSWFADYFNRVRTLRDKHDPTLYDSLETIKALAEKRNYKPAVCRYHIEKAAFYLSQKKTASAIECFEIAIRLAEKEKLYREEGDAYLGLANLYQFNGNTIDAAQNYLHAVDLLKDLRRKRSLIGLYWNLNTTLNKLKQKNGALQNMLSAIITKKSDEADLVKIINTRNSEEEGMYFPDQTLIREGGGDAIWVVFGNAKFPILNLETLSAYGGASREVQRIPAGSLRLIPDMPGNGSILMEFSGDPKVYLVKDAVLFHISSPEVLENYGGWDAVYFVPNGSLTKFPKSAVQVTKENVRTIFNVDQEFDKLSSAISQALEKNKTLSNELSHTLADRNAALQKRKILLWVTGIGITSLLVIVFLLIRNFRQKQTLNAQSIQNLKKQEELERKTAIEKERTRIATDMHDDLGAGLSRIKFLSETIGIKKQQDLPVEEEISSIRSYSHEMIDKMGEIVWALNEKNDSLSDLLSYTRAYVVQYLSQNGIRVKVETPDLTSPILVSGEFRRNTYLVVKEALHNIVKHAQANEVILRVEIDSSLNILLQDDGIGFDPLHTRPFSNGLVNMKKRVSDIGGHLSIIHQKGTSIHFSIPLPS